MSNSHDLFISAVLSDCVLPHRKEVSLGRTYLKVIETFREAVFTQQAGLSDSCPAMSKA